MSLARTGLRILRKVLNSTWWSSIAKIQSQKNIANSLSRGGCFQCLRSSIYRRHFLSGRSPSKGMMSSKRHCVWGGFMIPGSTQSTFWFNSFFHHLRFHFCSPGWERSYCISLKMRVSYPNSISTLEWKKLLTIPRPPIPELHT